VFAGPGLAHAGLGKRFAFDVLGAAVLIGLIAVVDAMGDVVAEIDK